MNFSYTTKGEELTNNIIAKVGFGETLRGLIELGLDEGFKAGRIAEHKDVLERALNFTLPEIKEKINEIKEQARQKGRNEFNNKYLSICENSGLLVIDCECGNCEIKTRNFIQEAKDEARQEGRNEGEALFISELMNRNKTPHWISVLPQEMTIASEKLFSFSEEYSKLREEQVRQDERKKVLAELEALKKKELLT